MVGVARTLAQALAGAKVDGDALQAEHGSLLEIGRRLLGVVPACHAYLDIWRPAFVTYNVLVPELLNVPGILRRRYRLREIVSLAMYTSSRAAGCMYCSAHACTFAQLRGVDLEKILAATRWRSMSPVYTDGERIAIAVAEALGRVPCTLTPAQKYTLETAYSYSDADIEWIILAVSLMGWLNKVMDAIGIPLEPRMLTSAGRTIADTGWTPGQHATYGTDQEDEEWDPRLERVTVLGVVPLLPSVIWRSRQWTRGVPTRSTAVRAFLLERTGYDFPVVANLRHRRARRAIAAALALNTDPATTVLGLRPKMQAGQVYAAVIGDDWLAQVTEQLWVHAEKSEPLKATDDDTLTLAAVDLARAASASPAQIRPQEITAVTRRLTPAQIIEVISWLATLQLVHRLAAYKNLRVMSEEGHVEHR